MQLGDPEMYQHGFDVASLFPVPDLDSGVSPILGAVGRAFRLNMMRVQGLGTLPIQLVAVATINEAARIEARVNKGISLHDPRVSHPKHPQFDEKLFTEIDTDRMRLVAEWMKKENKDALFTQVGIEGMNTIIGWNEDKLWFGVQGTLSAMLIGLWTAFESLAQDTWITAVNCRPMPLATNVMSASDSELKAGNQSKSLSYAHLAGAGFDLRRTMGNLLFNERKVDFQQLKTIRAAYKVAFEGELESAFDADNTNLSRLEAVRNVFVHKGGVIDNKFLKRIGDDPAFKTAKEGHLVFVSGHYVSMQANAVVSCASKIVKAVDK
jgi:hypothetical protein